VLEELAALSDSLNKAMELNEILNHTFQTAQRLVNVDQLVLFIVGHSERLLAEPFEKIARPEMAAGGSDWWEGIEVTVGENITGQAIADKKVDVVNDLTADSRRKYERTDREVKSMVCLPLVLEEQAMGSLNAYKNEAHEWTQNEVNLLKIITSTATSAFARSDLKERIRNKTTQMVYAFSKAIGAKTAWNKDHSDRVTAYAMLIGRQLGYSGTALRIIRQTGMLHDVGKLYVGGYILDKPGPLTPEEREVMDKHPIIGVEIISNLDIDQCIPGVKYHHERMDGSGYPDGLKGDSIPIVARIIAVADSFDAMTSDRPYRKAKSAEEACKELAYYAGRLYDPEIVKAFLNTHPEKHVKIPLIMNRMD